MSKAIDELIRFQTDRGLDKQEYNQLNAMTSIFEELLESYGHDLPKENRHLLKSKLNSFVQTLVEEGTVTLNTVTEEDIVDSIADNMVFCIGDLLKLSYDPLKVLEQVGLEINSRTGSMVDGKFVKDDVQANKYVADYNKCKLKN